MLACQRKIAMLLSVSQISLENTIAEEHRFDKIAH